MLIFFPPYQELNRIEALADLPSIFPKTSLGPDKANEPDIYAKALNTTS